MIFFNKSVVYKNQKSFERRFGLHPLLQSLLDNVLIFIKLRFGKKLEGIVTSTVSLPIEDVLLHRKSTTHQDGRAFDLSVKNLTVEELGELKIAFTKVAGHLGAIDQDTGLPKLIVDHDSGHGRHLHFQISRDVARNFPYERPPIPTEEETDGHPHP